MSSEPNLRRSYSFCRIADDLVDEAGDRKNASDVLDQCALELERRFTSKVDCVEQGYSKYPELTQAIKIYPQQDCALSHYKVFLKDSARI